MTILGALLAVALGPSPDVEAALLLVGGLVCLVVALYVATRLLSTRRGGCR